MPDFRVLVYTPAAQEDVAIAIAGSRAGGVGVFDAQTHTDVDQVLGALGRLIAHGRGDLGVRLPYRHEPRAALLGALPEGIGWIVCETLGLQANAEALSAIRARGVRVLLEITDWDADADLGAVDGVIVKGHEAGGIVGEDTAFILLQKILAATDTPVWVHGGIGLHSAAGCLAAGAAGVVLDNQLLLTRESPLADRLRPVFKGLVGTETVAMESIQQGSYFRILDRPGYQAAKAMRQSARALEPGALFERCLDRCGWDDPTEQILPIGQDLAFAETLAARFGTVGRVIAALQDSVRDSIAIAADHGAFDEGAPLAQALDTRYPIIQGPMTRVSDSAAFAVAVASAGALPMLALALQKGPQVAKLLQETSERIDGRPWGIGLLGFAPTALLAEQVAASKPYKPSFVLIAGGRPDQALEFEKEGIPGFLHVPSPRLLALFIEQGARRFVFEGRECGGHIGPLSSFVLWNSMVDQLLSSAHDEHVAREIQVLFAGGIHDRRSAAIVGTLAAPLIKHGVKVGILMGTAYLFTKEIVESGAIVPDYQSEALACARTVSLESGTGHATRCALTPFAQQFIETKRQLEAEGRDADSIREVLEDMSLGRLRLASKGKERRAKDGRLVNVHPEQQRKLGQYMIGQVAGLRDKVISVADLHHEVASEGSKLIRDRAAEVQRQSATHHSKAADIAIVGIGAMYPGADTTRQYWENILDGLDAITEIPKHRWDWRLYFDADQSAKDRIYSKWGGFLADLTFDPTRYGIPPNAVKFVDPIQLMALEVVRQTLDDAGYGDGEFDGERASVIFGASGGAGDVGMQYGLRSELPRFEGTLPDEVAERLPTWTEDTFAGILLNVVAGRAANRFNFGGVNFTVDAACASSLAAIYQAAVELEDRRSDLVIAGGVDTMQGPFGYLCFSKTRALSPTGRCRTFDASSDGIVISEGIGMVALKRLEDAERDGDHIYAVIKGIGGSSDGRAKGLTAPLPEGQLRALNRSYEKAGYSPKTVRLFEAHGTGTVAGDTAELETTTRLLRSVGAPPRGAVVGSVKTMIGHTKAAAGVAGLIKVALALESKVLPPHANVAKPNATLSLEDCPLYLVRQPQPWVASTDHPRRASVSAFGFGGTNFHIALEEYRDAYLTASARAPRGAWTHELFVWNRDDDLSAELQALHDVLAQGARPRLRDLAYSLCSRWESGRPSLCIVASDPDSLQQRIAAALARLAGSDGPGTGVYLADAPMAADGKVAALFSGQGSQYPDMLRELAILFPEIAAPLAEADAIFTESAAARPAGPERLSSAIYPPGRFSAEDEDQARRTLTRTDVAQPALGAIEAGLWEFMRGRLGLRVHMTAGHSYGEYPALYAAGAFDFKSLIRLSEARGRLIVQAAQGSDLGSMAAVQAQREEVERIAAEYPDVQVANHNAPTQTILAGGTETIEAVVTKLTAAGYTASRLPVAAAFHSPFVAPAGEAFGEFIEGVEFAPPTVPVFSNTTATQHPDDPTGIRSNLVAQLAKPVEFVAEIKAMYEAGARVFVEIGPKGVLSRLVSMILEGQPHISVALDGGDGGIGGFLNAIGLLTAQGVDLNLKALFAGRDCRELPLHNLLEATREQPIPGHAWIINGSGVRRASEPPRIVGVTLEQVKTNVTASATQTAHPQVPDAPASAPTPPGQHSNTGAAASDTNVRISTGATRSSMTEVYYPESGDDRQGVLESYFETMRQFIVSQEAVMSAYLGAAPVSRRRVVPTRSFAGAASSRPALAQPATQAPPPAAAQPQPAPVAAAPPPQTATPTPPVTAVQPAPAPAVEPKPTASSSAPDARSNKGNGSDMSRDALVEQLLQIVEDRTGYPKDMIGMDQNMEADLGIDSIKRVEIAGALLKALPQWMVERIGAERDKINTQKTLSGIVDLIATNTLSEGGNARPFDSAGAGIDRQITAALPRFIMRCESQPVEGVVPNPVPQGTFVITEDSLGVASCLAALLEAAGARSVVIPATLLEDPSALEERAAGISEVAGLVHLAPLGEAASPWDQDLQSSVKRMERNEKSLFRLARLWAKPLSRGTLVAASGLGGTFGRMAPPKGLLAQGGAVGLVKSAREEWPQARAKAVDLDPKQPPESLAQQILQEIRLPGGRLEVGYPSGVRTIFRTVRTAVEAEQFMSPAHDWVVLATGGARGITAEVLGGLAQTGLTLILTGRTPLPPSEPAELAAITDEMQLRRYFIHKAKQEGTATTPASVERQIATVLRDREILANIHEFEGSGARVIYRVVDVREPQSMATLFEEIYGQFGRLDGIVHGAGIIEDRLIVDKTPESWSRVVGTKIDGLFLIARYVRPETLRFLVLFGSGAGRYGNSGQADYATANELMNRLACQLRAHWATRTKIAVLNWGPWAATRHGKGMVTPQTEQKFAEKGVTLVSPDMGRRLFMNELLHGDPEQVEIVAGEGPWDNWEDQMGALEAAPVTTQVQQPLLHHTRTETGPKGDQVLFHNFDEALDLYLAHHRIDEISVVPAAVALELMAEAASRLWPGWQVNSVSDLRVLKGLTLEPGRRLTVAIAGLTSAHGDATGFDVTMEIRSEKEPSIRHYRCVVHLATTPLESSRFESVLKTSSNPMTSAEAYDRYLFHGPRFQVISRIGGLDQKGALATVEPTRPNGWVAGVDASTSWLFDPGIVDSGPQMNAIWSCVTRDEFALPNRIGRVTRFNRPMPEQLKMHYLVYPDSGDHRVAADVAFVDSEGYLILMMEEVEGTSSAALNRLRGQWSVAVARHSR